MEVIARSLKSKAALLWVLAIFYLLCTSIPANAVLPPRVYKERAIKSKVKAIAVVKGISEITRKPYARKLELIFGLVKNLSSHYTPKTFKAHCWVILPGFSPPPGGEIYYRPQVGERVFVTVSEIGGKITSYTRLTPELEQALKETPPKIKYGMGRVVVVK